MMMVVVLAIGAIVLCATTVIERRLPAESKNLDRSVLTWAVTLFVFTHSIINSVVKGGDGNPGEWILVPWAMIMTYHFQASVNQQIQKAAHEATKDAAADARAATASAPPTDTNNV